MLMDMDGQQQGLHRDWTRGGYDTSFCNGKQARCGQDHNGKRGHAIFTFKLVISTVAGPEQQVPVS